MKIKYKNSFFYIILIISSFIQPAKQSSDIFFLYKQGDFILNNGFPYSEVFSMHADLDFVMSNWLSSVVCKIIIDTVGFKGYIIHYSLIILLSSLFVYKILILLNNNKDTCIYLSVLHNIIIVVFFQTRPYVYSYLLNVIVIYIVLYHIKNKSTLILLYLPLIALLQSNLHSSMLLFLIIFMLPFVCDITKKYSRKVILLAICLMCLVSFINPYGLDAVTYLFNSLDSAIKLNNQEMNSILSNNNYIVFYIFINIFCITSIVKNKVFDLSCIFLYVGVNILCLYAYRNLIYLPLSFVFILGLSNKEYFIFKYKTFIILVLGFLASDKTFGSILNLLIFSIIFVAYKKREIALTFVYSTIVILLFLCAISFSLSNFSGGGILRELPRGSKIYTSSTEAGTLSLYYDLKPYWDNRSEVYIDNINNKNNYYKDIYEVQNGIIQPEDFLSKYHFDYLFFDKEDALYYYIVDNNNYYLYNQDSWGYLYKSRDN